MYEDTQSTQSTLYSIRQNKVANVATSIVAFLALQYASLHTAYAGDAKPKAKAPLEERLDKVPKMQVPERINSYTPKTPGPFSVIDVNQNLQSVEGLYDEKTRTFDGKVKIYGQDADISLLVGPKESDEHALILKIGNQPLTNLTINKAGENLFMDWDKNVGAFAYEIDGKKFIIGFSYMDRDEKKNMGETKTIDLVYQAFLLTDKNRVPKSVRENAAKGNFLLYSSVKDGEAITCNFVNNDIIGSSSRPDPAVYCREVLLENDLDKLVAQQNDDVKKFAKDVKIEVQNMLKTGAEKDSILGYVELMTSEAKRRLNLDIDLLQKRRPDIDRMSPGLGTPHIIAVALLEERLVKYVEENYVEKIVEAPAPLPDPVISNDVSVDGMDDKLPIVPLVSVKPAPVVTGAKDGAKNDVKYAAKDVVNDAAKDALTKDVHVKEDPKSPKSLDVKIAETPIHPAFDFTPKVEPKKEDTAGEDDFWTSPLAIGLYVAAGVLVAGAVGTGVYFGTRDNGGGPDPQPPVGDPTMSPGDKW